MALSNRAHIFEQHDSYRRGLVLGLTMAEIVILIIFILLLAVATILSAERDKRRNVEHKLILAEKIIAELTEQITVFNEEAGGKDVAELVRELVVARSTITKFDKVMVRLEEAEELIQKIESVAKQAGVNPTPEGIFEAIEKGKKLNDIISQMGGNSVVDTALKNKELSRENKRLEGQLANSQKKLKILGKGNEMPSCWAAADGTVEYIYYVAVTNKGMIVRETKLPHRNADRSVLPISKVVLDKEVSSSEFRLMIRPLYQWSVDKKCRFYVKIFDQLGPTEKELYKQRLKIVEGQFYRDFRIYDNF